MNLDERRRALLRLVQDYRDQECRRILEAARHEAAGILRHSYGAGRAHLHERIVAERNRARARILAARADQATRVRFADERRKFELLASAWPLVRERLLAQWQRPEPRRLWVRTYLRRALELLPEGHWRVRHAPEWSDAERAGVLAELPEVAAQDARFKRDAGIEAGLVVSSRGALLDASLQGLLSDREGLEARLLALIAAEGTAPAASAGARAEGSVQ